MSNQDKTCGRCSRFTASTTYSGFGSCALIVDTNEIPGWGAPEDTTRAYSWDYEGYRSGAYVGERFGCIHFDQQVQR